MTTTGSDASPTLRRQWERAQRYVAEGQYNAARATIEALLVREPEYVHGHVLLATVDLAQHRLRDTCARLRWIAGMLPNDADLIATVAFCLHRVGETVAMRDCVAHREVSRTRSGPALVQLAQMYQLLGLHRQALELLDRACDSGFCSPDLQYQRSLELQFNGKIEESERGLAACIARHPWHGRAVVELARMRRQTLESNHLDLISAQLEHVERGSEHHAAFQFARFKELDDLGRYPEAWAALLQANAIMWDRVQHDVAGGTQHFAAIDRICSAEFVAPVPARRREGPVPIFIVGMPRAGTTLLERIVGNHSQVAPCGELQDFAWQMRWEADVDGSSFLDDRLLERAPDLDYADIGRRYLDQTQWRAGNKPFFTDKLPLNFLLAGFIRRALPQARILHMVRNPMDVCFSNWKAMFGDMYGYSYDLKELAGYYAGYRRLMDHWHTIMPGAILDVSYADLVAEPEREIARVFGFCSLPFEPGCSDIARNRLPVATLSAVQIREPIRAGAPGAWLRYSEGMQPLHSALCDAGIAEHAAR